MKVKLLMLLMVLVCGLGSNACQRADEQEVQAAREASLIVAPAEQDFLIKTALEDRAEIEMARVVQQKSDNGEVRDYARTLADEHARNFEKLTVLLQLAGINPPVSPGSDMRESLDKLWSLKGGDLDREYINMMVDNHRLAVDTFRELSGTARNNKVRIYANDTLPRLQDHLEKAQELQSALFGGNVK
jgi:putative membrane protein